MRILMYIRNSRTAKAIALVLVLNLVVSSVYTPSSYALTSGPAQPEANQFQPVGMTDLVDPFTGDFSYNIPLLEIGDYPINLSYNSNIGMDSEASWAGLGWNVNIGAITRSVRGFPDDFQGDQIIKRFNIKPNITHGISVAADLEVTGYDGENENTVKPTLNLGFVIQHNSYDGFSMGQSFNVGLSIGKQNKPATNIGLGFSSDKNGLNISPNVSFSSSINGKSGQQNSSYNLGLGLNINSRAGISSLTLDGGIGFGGTSKKIKTPKYYPHLGIVRNKYRTSGSVGIGFGGSLNFASPTYTPQHSFPFSTYAFAMDVKAGGAIKWVDIGGKIGGFGVLQVVDYKEENNPAYGYCYSQEGQGNLKALHDFNREKDGSFTPNIQYLPVTNYTYDVFNINAQGLGGNFRAFRNDFGYIYDKAVNNNSDDASLSMEANIGDVVDIGINFKMVHTDSDTRLWEESKGNIAAVNTKFQKKKINEILEPFTFRMVGDMANNRSMEQYDRLGEDKPVRIATGNNITDSKLLDHTNAIIDVNAPRRLSQRPVRSTSIEYLSVGEVRAVYPHMAAYIPYFAPDHHIGAIIVTGPDGTRYVFGLPAYNRTQKEITFAVADQNGNVSINPSTRLVSYTSSDNSTGNTKGIDNYFEEITTGPYVHTWMLTEVLSPDYVDYTGNGPTTDDLGTYTKFTYGNFDQFTGKYYPNLVQNWRTPVDGVVNTATHYEGLKSDGYDDKANIIYGQKDVWYVRTIESKTQVAEFELTAREDAYGVAPGGTNTARGGPKMQKLSKIRLYSKKDYERLLSGASVTPVKTVHLIHDYSLCPDVPNNSGATVINPADPAENLNAAKGKLTLKQLYFTYEKSGRAKFSPYTFDYDEGNVISAYSNPAYKSMEYDRWGNYKPESGGLKNTDYPYSEQDRALQDLYASAWCLRRITLPSGGAMNITYESDDYAYVQDKEATRMFKVLGVSDYPNDAGYGTRTTLYDKSDPHAPYTYLYFRLEEDPALGDYPDPGTVSDIKAYIDREYLKGNENNTEGPSKYFYFRFLTNLDEGGPSSALEYISGYAEVDYADAAYCGALVDPGSGKYEIGWIKMKTVDTGDDDGNPSNGDAHPISKAAWQFSRIHTPRYAFNQPPPNANFGEAFIDHLVNSNIVSQLIQMFTGVNQRMKNSGYGSYFSPGESWIKLMDPDGTKLGGGNRVKDISITDNWSSATSGNELDMAYVQTFDYTLDDKRSSGVAEWEPVMGADENIHRIPNFYDVNKTLVNDERFYQEFPMGESFYPSPSVGYSRVTVKNVTPHPDLITNATGKTVYEFYTAKDYPTRSHHTELAKVHKQPNPFGALLGWSYDYMTVSQGYVVEINDMHGRPKEEAVYQEGKIVPITRKVYKYKEAGPKRLSSTATLITPQGQLVQDELGVDFDIIADFRESNSATFNANVAGNIGVTLLPSGLLPIPLISGSVFPKFGEEVTRFRSAVVTKVIRRTGLLESMEVYDLGAKVATTNVAYDQLTGQVLLTQVNNAYDDDRFALTIPAHWTYDRMGMAGDNWGFEFDTKSGTNWNRSDGAIISGSVADTYLKPGDELIRHYVISPPALSTTGGWNQYSSHLNKCWVIENNTGDKFLIDQSGQPITTTDNSTNFRFKVIRSGNRNMPLVSVQSMESLDKPVQTVGPDTYLEIDNDKKILNASAVEYSEIWRTHDKLDNIPERFAEYTTICTPNSTSVRFISLLNKLIEQDLFLSVAPLALLHDHPEYGNLVQVLYGNCVPFYTAVVDNTSPIGSYSTHTTIHMSVLNVCGEEDDTFCQMSLTCTEPAGMVPAGKIAELEHLEIVTAIPGILPTFSIPYNLMNVPYDLLLMGTFTDGSTALFVMKSEGPDDCLSTTLECEDHSYLPMDKCRLETTDVINPYVWGIMGNWRPKKQYSFITERENVFTGASNEMNMRTDGYYGNFFTFWTMPSPGSDDAWTVNTAHIGNNNAWKWVTEITNYSPYSFEVENMDALGIYSAAVYGYRKTLPIAVAGNCKYKELAYDGFEDYEGAYECYKDHFKFDMHYSQLTVTEAHTGKYSMKLVDNDPVQVTRKITAPAATRTGPAYPFVFNDMDNLGLFSPEQMGTDKTFVLSFWIKKDGYGYQIPYIHDYNNPVPPLISVNGSPISPAPVLKRKSEIIEGWQMYEFEFDISAGASGNFALRFDNTLSDVYYLDDVRIYPADATMKSFVYDARTLYYMAELDENNFATFYEYDEDGSLIRVKKETERGIMTIQENRGKMHKSNTMQ